MPFVNRGAAFAEDTSVTVDLSGSTVFWGKKSLRVITICETLFHKTPILATCKMWETLL